ncbi:hypothetical protein BU23DRAFT_628662 [Bimuria novae-zelandiae CBS 107.79]|uniref:Spherulation-specific family 4 n=1 Tax=Bimuria novae-zelandiae CBS 107.79 TaxID=1447943 RepID=A0A6A5UKT7_9PLEO|nr:hypothetical protein BU23DRAFT_628662 [Bimuria novae-zelandiae CBS 107.79]
MTLPKSRILLPLYIYPERGAWDPLFEAVVPNPTLDFVIIVNPNSGPGSEPWWPNAEYVREIPRLNAHQNVRTVGYVSTAYCKRPIEKVLADVDRYAAWSCDERFPGLAVDGIFFDETPNVFSEKAKEYLDAITAHVKRTGGLLGENMVVHNPGTSVDIRFASPGLDIATVAELAYADFKTTECQEWLATSPFSRDKSCYMIYAVPEEVLEEFVARDLRNIAEYIFVTDRKTDVYNAFGASWTSFVGALADS